MAVGAALALADTGGLPVAVLGDGDFLMGGTAVWTAAHYGLPLLIVVANNAFFYNNVVHAERVAAQRQRPPRLAPARLAPGLPLGPPRTYSVCPGLRSCVHRGHTERLGLTHSVLLSRYNPTP